MKFIDYVMCFFIILLFISAASCSKEKDMCTEYYHDDVEIINECEFGICTQIVQVTTTCISYEGK